VIRHPSASAPAPAEPLEPPADLDPEVRAVWIERAAFSIARGMLCAGSVAGFRRYCETVVLERYESKSSGRGGTNHRGLLALLMKMETDYGMNPIGRPLVQPAGEASRPPASKLGRFRE
jgi:hypothetical protein